MKIALSGLEPVNSRFGVERSIAQLFDHLVITQRITHKTTIGRVGIHVYIEIRKIYSAQGT